MSQFDETAGATLGLTLGLAGLVALDLFLAWRRGLLKEWVRAWRR